MLDNGFESSSGTTEEFKTFCRTFKKEFKDELKTIRAKDIVFHCGHFYISGFYTIDYQPYYFSISDVRYFPEPKMLIRKAKDYQDYTGETNTYRKIKKGMFQ